MDIIDKIKNNTIKELELEKCDIKDFKEICNALKINKSITNINLECDNYLFRSRRYKISK